jgi:hypothetical protein
MRQRQILSSLLVLCLDLLLTAPSRANPWNGKVSLQAFWWGCDNRRYQTNEDGTGCWYTYLPSLPRDFATWVLTGSRFLLPQRATTTKAWSMTSMI